MADPTQTRHLQGATQVMPLPTISRSPEEALRVAWPELARKMAESQASHVMTLVEDASDRVRVFALDASEQEPCDVIVGRHTHCDVVIGRTDVALRQLLVRLYRGPEGPRARILDLHTDRGFRDETGRDCRSVLGDRHLFVRFGGHHLFLMRSDSALADLAPEEVWQALPPSVHEEAEEVGSPAIRPLEMRPRLAPVSEPRTDREVSRVFHLEDPAMLDADGADSGAAIGALVFEQRDLYVRLRVEALKAGVLLGRYDRCQVRTPKVDDTPMVSRVHLCLLLDETGLWAIDTGSTNGSFCDGKPFRTLRLGETTAINLARRLDLRWQAA